MLHPRTRCLVLCLCAAIAGCEKDDLDPEMARPDDLGYARTRRVTLIDEGEAAYVRHCIGCHGEAGDGNGEAAKFLHPKPRNFQLSNYKFSSTRAGQLPTDDDLRRTIKEGLKGSAMPPFDLLPERTVEALVAYIKTFSPKWEEDGSGPPIPYFDNPYQDEADKTQAIARGEVIYHGYSMCWNCHPSYVDLARINEHRVTVGLPTFDGGRPSPYEAVGKENSEGYVIFPPDFRRDFVRSGADVKDLYRSISAGITGTAMATWVDSMHLPGLTPEDAPRVQPEDLWALAYYVESLIRERPKKFAEDQVVLRPRKQDIYLDGEPARPPPKPEPEPEPDEDVEFDFD